MLSRTMEIATMEMAQLLIAVRIGSQDVYLTIDLNNLDSP